MRCVPALMPQMDLATVQWGPFLNCIFWNINYWDSASTLAGEVADPRHIYPRCATSTAAAPAAHRDPPPQEGVSH